MKITEENIVKFWSRVDKEASAAAGGSNCWLWVGRTGRWGYGSIKAGGREQLAHRMSAFMSGKDVANRFVCHACDTPACVNPDHLFTGTPADNVKDRHAKGRSARGSKFPNTRLNEATVRLIRSEYAAGGVSTKTLGARFGVSGETVRDVVKRVNWKYVV